MDAAYALELFHNKSAEKLSVNELRPEEAQTLFSPIDLERLQKYSRSLVDFHVISDLLPNLARLFFGNRLPGVRLNKTQQVILLGLGLQHKTVERLASEFNRLLGDSNSVEKGMPNRQAADASAILARLEDTNTTDCGTLETVSSSLRPKDTESPGGTGWAKRIRGLLFVMVRELVRSLEQIVRSREKNEHMNTLLPAKGQSLTVTGSGRSKISTSGFLREQWNKWALALVDDYTLHIHKDESAFDSMGDSQCQ
ncbi:unnamed protein product [Echinostoma caproni]|uniref:tRNA_bind_2 domain-containing protein n=1 Tax=Echinostoma caproni TaxID=27848 RepID=A0A183B6V1_9TREM|nr:unnamed protein product [Echinostoma caproni]